MEKWSKEKAWKWYKSLPWIRGFNFVPSICVNRIEMWQEYNWDKVKECMKDELKLAKEWGFNSVRVITSLELYIDQKESLLNHIEEFLKIADENGIYVMFTFGNDCVVAKGNYSWPKYGPQPFDFGYHSGVANSPHVVMNEPGYSLIDEEKYRIKYFEMVEGIIGKYRNDKRIIVWDMFNEPGNSRRGMMSWNVIKKSFDLARKLNPIQPLAAGAWSFNIEKDMPEIERKSLEESDIILYHCYGDYSKNKAIAEYLEKTYDRPLMNTEWLHRIWHCTVKELFPYFREKRIGCFNWGFVTGKSQTKEPWEWLFNAYDNGEGRDWDFSKWQHDLVRANHRPYDFEEYRIIKEECEKADKEQSTMK